MVTKDQVFDYARRRDPVLSKLGYGLVVLKIHASYQPEHNVLDVGEEHYLECTGGEVRDLDWADAGGLSHLCPRSALPGSGDGDRR